MISRLFSRKSKRKRANSINVKLNLPVCQINSKENNAHLAKIDTQNERIVFHTTPKILNSNAATQLHASADGSFIATNTRFPSPLARNSSPKESIFRIDDVPSKTSIHEVSQKVIDEVTEFYQRRSYPQTDVRILVSKNVIIYVLGTNHANTQCKDDVVDIIEKVQPQSVLVELCPLRACGCEKHVNNAFQTAPKFTFRYLRKIINQLGFLPAMIFLTDVFREHLVSESSLLHYGGEFIAAMTTAQNLKNCRLILADRPIEITVKRQASAMGNWRGIRVALQVTLALLFKKHMKKLMMDANRIIFDDPKTYEVLVFERDLYLTYSIQEAAKLLESDSDVSRIVAVLGQGHVQGVESYWGKVPSEFIPFIMSPQTILDK